MNHNRFFSFTIMLAAVVSAGITGAEERPYYMWTDSNGVLNISQERPRDQANVKEVSPALSPQMLRRPGYAHSDTTKTQQLNCQIGRLALAELNAHRNIYVKRDDGLWHLISDAQRKTRVNNAQKLIQTDCPSP